MSARRIKRSALRLQSLEDRLAPSTYTVSNSNNSGSGSLRQAISDANNHSGADTIVFSSHFNSPRTITLASQISITGPVTIDGPSAANVTISGNSLVRIFNTQSAPAGTAIDLLDLTLKHGYVVNYESGGAIRSADETIRATRCVFLANFAYDGGAIAATNGGSVTLTDCEFMSNTAIDAGGAVWVVNGGSVTATDCDFVSNAVNSGGGAILVGGTGSLTAIRCNLQSNVASNAGGAMAIFGGVLTATDCVFLANVSLGGGAIQTYETGSSAMLTGCTIAGNSANNGGGLYLAGSLILEASTVSGNTATGFSGYYGYYPGYGGGILVRGPATIRNSTISSNSAGFSSGIFAGTLVVQNSTIAGNSSSYFLGSAGGIGAQSLAIESSIVVSNSAATAPDVSAATANVRNSLIFNRSGIATFNDLGGNRPAGENPRLGPLQNNGGPTRTHLLLPGSPCLNAGSNPTNLTTDQRGFVRMLGVAVDMGAVEGVDVTPTVTPITMATDVSTSGASDFTVVVRYEDDVAINPTTIDLNDIAVSGPGYDAVQNATALQINGSGADFTVTYTFPAPGGAFDFVDAGLYTIALAANQVGDADAPTPHFVPAGTLGTFRVAIAGTIEVDEVSDIDDGNLSDGHVSLREAVRLTNAALATADRITFDPVVFGSPRTITLAGGQFSITDPLTIVGPGAGLLTLNAGGTSRHFSFSGPIVAGAPSLSGITLTNGGQVDSGGAILSAQHLTLANVVITNCRSESLNYATNGGAVFVAGSMVASNCTFTGNSTSGLFASGGAILANGGLTLDSSTVSGNQAVGGYGYYGYYPGNGGGISANGAVTIRNSTISGNSAGYAGGVSANTLLVQNSTITANVAGFGGGTGISASTATIASSIVALNAGAGGLDILATTAVFAGNSSIFNRSGITAFYDLGGNRPAGENPMLAPLANNGGPTKTHALLPGSPCIDAGNNTVGLVYDQRGAGFARSANGSTDIGAFEVQSAAPAVALTIIGNGSAQRSRVSDLTVTFTSLVSFAGSVASAFSLTRNGGGAVELTATASIVGGLTVVTLNGFTGSETEFGSLRDGRYTLTALASQISANGQQMASNFTFGEAQGLFRFFGDANGDRRIDISDFGPFSATYNKASTDPAFNAMFDFNNDGRIDIVDFGQFSVRFFTNLP